MKHQKGILNIALTLALATFSSTGTAQLPTLVEPGQQEVGPSRLSPDFLRSVQRAKGHSAQGNEVRAHSCLLQALHSEVVVAKRGYDDSIPANLFTENITEHLEKINTAPFGLEDGQIVISEELIVGEQHIECGCIISMDSDEFPNAYRLVHPGGIIPAIRVLESIQLSTYPNEGEELTGAVAHAVPYLERLELRSLLDRIGSFIESGTPFFDNNDRDDARVSIDPEKRFDFFNGESILNALLYLQHGFSKFHEMLQRQYHTNEGQKREVYEILVDVSDRIEILQPYLEEEVAKMERSDSEYEDSEYENEELDCMSMELAVESVEVVERTPPKMSLADIFGSHRSTDPTLAQLAGTYADSPLKALQAYRQ